jgi:hypothetical protein
MMSEEKKSVAKRTGDMGLESGVIKEAEGTIADLSVYIRGRPQGQHVCG